LQTRHTVDRGDMDTCFLMYRCSKTSYCIITVANKATFAFQKVVWRHLAI